MPGKRLTRVRGRLPAMVRVVDYECSTMRAQSIGYGVWARNGTAKVSAQSGKVERNMRAGTMQGDKENSGARTGRHITGRDKSSQETKEVGCGDAVWKGAQHTRPNSGSAAARHGLGTPGAARPHGREGAPLRVGHRDWQPQHKDGRFGDDGRRRQWEFPKQGESSWPRNGTRRRERCGRPEVAHAIPIPRQPTRPFRNCRKKEKQETCT